MKFSGRLKKVISFSREESVNLGSSFIGTEHILLGLLREDSSIIQILKGRNIDLSELRKQLKLLATEKKDKIIPPVYSLPLTSQAEAILHEALIEAKVLQSGKVETVHLMLAILKNKENAATQILDDFGIDYDSFKSRMAAKNEKMQNGEYVGSGGHSDMTNPVFSFKRFGLLIKKHWTENNKWYLMALPAMGGLIMVWYAFMILVSPGRPLLLPIQYSTYYTGLFFAGCLLASTIFADLSDRPKAIHYLLVPASTLEKLLIAILFCVFVFFILYTIVFYLVDIPMVNFFNSTALKRYNQDHLPGEIFQPSEVVNVFKNIDGLTTGKTSIFLLLYLVIQSLFILGSVYFTRAVFIKTTVYVLIIGLFLFLVTGPLLDRMLPPQWHTANVIEWSQSNGRMRSNMVRLPAWVNNTVGFLCSYSLPLILWFITYIRLKEKEV